MSIGPVQFECAKHFVDLLSGREGRIVQEGLRLGMIQE
jgi:hypothetical protein